MIRIVGLSATLPNYKDVAAFLRVNLQTGLFYFDSRFRPVPLSQCFVGIKARKPAQQIMEMNQVCYDKVFDHVKNGLQVVKLIFSVDTILTNIFEKVCSNIFHYIGDGICTCEKCYHDDCYEVERDSPTKAAFFIFRTE